MHCWQSKALKWYIEVCYKVQLGLLITLLSLHHLQTSACYCERMKNLTNLHHLQLLIPEEAQAMISKGVRMIVMPFLIKIVALPLLEFPRESNNLYSSSFESFQTRSTMMDLQDSACYSIL